MSRGVPADAIDDYIAAKRKQRADAKPVEVWEVNWNCVEVYRRCMWEIELGSMGGVCYKGIKASEMKCVARILGIALDAETLDGIREMQGAAATVYNAKAAK
jgi:hypothetical protein